MRPMHPYLSYSSLLMSGVAGLGYAGTPISPEDAEEIVEEVRRVYSRIPAMFRPFIPSLPELLRKIPVCARKYTLGDLIRLLEVAHEEGRI